MLILSKAKSEPTADKGVRGLLGIQFEQPSADARHLGVEAGIASSLTAQFLRQKAVGEKTNSRCVVVCSASNRK